MKSGRVTQPSGLLYNVLEITIESTEIKMLTEILGMLYQLLWGALMMVTQNPNPVTSNVMVTC